ncbi:hypothetical protein VNI00_009923 [Paramarasmius palmivorus]|uniref:MYND-type domain-containing protein n=1 Tax=Paramarasmius palmivorus TaxID=297713 RepID=A0AAW0CJZ9_9AGAR
MSVKEIYKDFDRETLTSGSRQALSEIERWVSGDSQLLEAIPLIVRDLPAQIKLEEIDTGDAQRIIEGAQGALMMIADGLSADEFKSPKVLASIKESWPRIWLWASFLYFAYLRPESELYASKLPLQNSRAFSDTLLLTLAKLLNKMVLCDDSVTLLTTKPDGIAVAVYVHLLSAQNPPNSYLPDPEHEEIYTHARSILPTLVENRISYPWVVVALDNAPMQFASGVIKRVIYEFRVPYLDLDSLFISMSLFELCSTHSKNFNIALLRKHSIRWVCTIMKWAGKEQRSMQKHHKGSEHKLQVCVLSCAQYLQRVIAMFGRIAVIQALESRLLSSILKTAAFTGETILRKHHSKPVDIKDVYKDILNTILGFSVYYSVCRSLTRALRLVEDARWYQKMARENKFNEEYQEFRKMALERMVFKRNWEIAGYNLCRNEQCPLPRVRPPDGENHLSWFRCSGCEVEYYCSKSCQMSAWQSGHKSACRSMKEEGSVSQDGPPRHDSRDKDFMAYVTDQDLCRMKSSMLFQQSHYRHKHPELVPDEPLVSVLDYTKIPYKLTIMTGGEARQHCREAPLDWGKLLFEAKKLNGKVPLVLVIVPDAGKPFSWFRFNPGD